MTAELSKTVKFTYGDKVSTFRFSKADIIIPFHGQYTKVRELVQSILLFTKSNPYLIYLVDDASPNESFLSSVLDTAPVAGTRLPQQLGFAGALRAGFEKTQNPWVVFLHSDCLIKDPYWLQRLGETLLELKDKKVRLAHARTNNPMCEHPLLKSTTQEQVQKNKVVTTDDPLPLIAAMTHRGLFDHIGGFMKEYPYAGYEDVELFWRMKKRGFKQAVSGGAWVYHYGGATINELCSKNKKIKTIMDKNYDLCLTDISH